MTTPVATTAATTFWQKHGQKVIAGGFWLLLIGGYGYYYRANDLTTTTALLQLVDLLTSPWGPLLYILVYALRPLIFFSAAILTIASGSIFGSGSILNLALAVLYTIIGSNTSAMVAYGVGRFFGKGLLTGEKGGESSLLQRYAERLRHNSFETILIMRFIFLPYDLVNYLAGILRIDWKAFILASFLGSLPGTVAFVAFGASIDIKQLAQGKSPEFNPLVLLFGVIIFIVSIVISRIYKRREVAGQR